MREFLDTNILVYAIDRSAGTKQRVAAGLVERVWNEQSGCISVQVLQEFYTTTTGKVLRRAKVEEAQAVIEVFRNWPVFAPQFPDVLDAIAVQHRWQVSFWDAMVIHAAQALGCGVLWSEDLNSGQRYEEVLVQNPFAVSTR